MSSADRVFGMFGNNSKVEKSEANSDGDLNVPFGAATTPQFIISAGGIFHSKMSGYEDYAPCLWFELGSARLNTFDSSDHFTGDGRVVSKTTSVCMKYGVWSPILHEYLVTGRPIPEVIIKRLATLHSGFVELQATRYTDSYITTYEQRGDKIFFTFSFVKITDAQIVYDNTGRKLTGINAFEFDYTTTLAGTAPKDLEFMNETEAREG